MKRTTLFLAVFSAALVATVLVANQFRPAATGLAAHAAHATMATPF